ncbi:esterase-like activity of phytase family protein [Jannaschia sp. LMIT008]|uniref:esterase-like activity of phytase family protein n=1 Tax=Jannaschia maritima TaxID=3032585 RepID=UPI00281105F0|nr:esterase-like activity of phytase family protein [Jannaschia sp. LMIT008]
MRRGPGLALALTLLAPPACAAQFLGAQTWVGGWHGSGGYSGLWVSPDGRDFLTVSDRGGWVRGRLVRDARGAVAGVEGAERGAFLGRGGPLRGLSADAEGLAVRDGTVFVSFEQDHRVMRFADPAAPGERLPDIEGLAPPRPNNGLEALAVDAAGRLFAITETAEPQGFPVFVGEGGVWTRAFHVSRRGGFLVVGADIGPDGRLYVLERDFALIGFRSRIRSFDPSGGDEREEMVSALGSHDNLEGLAIWRDDAGRLRATMISDDNFRAVQRTEFVDYALGDAD